ncbi:MULTISPECIES: helix-turn-helix domain-containing protein [unclassified Streptomyces]|uniref:helix-turn-helix domain-containing protein n=1 Tax=unclassified Streptomyces TaxID=2593676 RepID=UPI002E2B8907|nr:helix-turn-helix transcriptional regulator [Streptomyces sp. NBC_01429]
MTSPLSTAEEAHKAVADRLMRMMEDAGLSGARLAALCDWDRSKTHRIIHRKTIPKPADIRAWCAACGRPEEAEALIEATRTAKTLYVQWTQYLKDGLGKAQRSSVYRETRSFRVYSCGVLPGMLQTEPYARGILRTIRRFRNLPDDVEDAVQARMERSDDVVRGNHQVAILMEESALYMPMTELPQHAQQLERFLSVIGRPNLSFGIIPHMSRRPVWPIETFYAFDDREVQVETLTAMVRVTNRSEVDAYLCAFAQMARAALYGSQAKALIRKALDACEA